MQLSSEQASKLVAMFAFGGAALMIWTSKDAQTRYRRVWGIAILSIAGAALSEFAPQIVGMYFALIILAYIVANFAKVSKVAHSIRMQSGVK